MKLKLLFAFLLFAEVNFTLAQTSTEKDKELNEKYWIYRDRFRKRFVNIGGVEDGQSLPFLTIFEGYNMKVLDKDKLMDQIPDGDKLKYMSGKIGKGEMGIELGHYLAVLATEYRLLKWDGAGIEEMTAIRNELYYAINAINRLDKNAETYFDPQTFPDPVNNQPNGFLIRDDIPHGFYTRWRNLGDHINIQGTENSGIFSVGKSAYTPYALVNGIMTQMPTQQRFYDEYGNVIVEEDEEQHVVGENFDKNYEEPKAFGNKWNEFSQDQLIGVLLGLRFITKFVDNDFVKPTADDAGFNLVTEAKNIMKRLLDHTSAIKDCASQVQHPNDADNPCSHYIADADCDALPNQCGIDNLHGRWIIKNPTNGKAVYRGPVSYTMGFAWPMAVLGKNILNVDYPWEDIHIEIDRVGNDPNWGRNVNCKNKFEIAVQMYQAITDPESDVGAWFRAIDSKFHNQNYYNVNMIIRAAVMAGKDQDNEWILEPSELYDLAWNFGAPQMEMFNMAINDVDPVITKESYQNFLLKAPCIGPFLTLDESTTLNSLLPNIDVNSEAEEQFYNLMNEIMTNRGRWFIEGNMYIPDELKAGEFNGIDYMLIHNIYRLKFASQISGKYVTNTCPCESSRQFLKNNNADNYIDPDWQPIELIGGSEPVQTINTVFRFPEYKDFGIPIPEYLTHNFWIQNNGVLNVTGDLTIGCSATEILDGGRMNVLKSSLTTKQKYLTISRNAGLNIKEGGTLYVEDGNTVIIDVEGGLTIWPGSHIILNGPNAILEIRGSLMVKPNAVFKIEGGTLGRGFIRWSMPNIGNSVQARSRLNLGANSKIELIGNGKTDKILEIPDHIFWTDNNNGAITTEVILRSCKIEMGKNAVMNLGTAVRLDNIRIAPKSGVTSYKGIVLWGNKHNLNNIEISGSRSGLKSFNMVGGSDFKATGLSITNSLSGLNIEGKGYQVLAYSTNINGSIGTDYGINATGIDRESSVIMANISNCTKGISHIGSLGSGLSVQTSLISAYQSGIEFRSPSSVLAQCNTISSIPLAALNLSQGIYATGGMSELGPSLGRNAGGNIFQNFNYSLFIDRNNLFFNEGNNNLASAGNIGDRSVFGEVSGIPGSGTSWTTFANHNIWDLNFNPPYGLSSPSENYNVWYKSTGGTYNPLTYIDNTYITTMAQFDNGRVARCNNTYTGGSIGGLYTTGKTINTTFFHNTNLKDAFETTLDKMYNPNAMDYPVSANYWYEILTDNEWGVPLESTQASYVGIGLSKMMENVGLYLINDSTEANSLSLNDQVLNKAYATLLFWKNLTASDTNYTSRQLNQQAKLGSAQILHNANDFINSKNIVDEMVATADGIWKEQADYWQCQWTRENEIKMSECNPDSSLMAAWPQCEYGQNNPNITIKNYWEEKVIPELKRQNQISKHMRIYPNPAKTLVTAELETSQRGTADINIFNSDGKQIKTISNIKLQLGINRLLIPVSDILPGIYTIAIETRNIKWNEKVVIE